MSKVNPFLMLGLNETVLGSVSDEDILTLAQSQYRALSRIFHPDAGGSAAIFAMISEAYESIQDEVARKEYLDDFMSSRADQLVRIQRDLMDLEEQRLEDIGRVRAEYANFLADFVSAQRSEESSPLNSGDVVLAVQDSISDSEMYSGWDTDRLSSEGLSVIYRRNGLVTISRLVNTNILDIDPEAEYDKGLIYVGKKTQVYPFANTWYRVALEPNSRAHKRSLLIDKQLQRTKKSGEALTVEQEGRMRDEALFPQYCLYAFDEQEAETTDLVLLGSLTAELVKHRTSDERPLDFQRMLEAPVDAKALQLVGKQFDYDEFQYYLGEIKSDFAEGDYLVAARLENNRLRFLVVGEILSHSSLKP